MLFLAYYDSFGIVAHYFQNFRRTNPVIFAVCVLVHFCFVVACYCSSFDSSDQNCMFFIACTVQSSWTIRNNLPLNQQASIYTKTHSSGNLFCDSQLGIKKLVYAYGIGIRRFCKKKSSQNFVIWNIFIHIFVVTHLLLNVSKLRWNDIFLFKSYPLHTSQSSDLNFLALIGIGKFLMIRNVKQDESHSSIFSACTVRDCIADKIWYSAPENQQFKRTADSADQKKTLINPFFSSMVQHLYKHVDFFPQSCSRTNNTLISI